HRTVATGATPSTRVFGPGRRPAVRKRTRTPGAAGRPAPALARGGHSWDTRTWTCWLVLLYTRPGKRVRGTQMKSNPVKRALRAGQPQVGTWLSMGSVAASRFLARVGFPWLTVDMEHTHTDIQTAAMMFGAIADAGCVPLARVPAGRHDYIKMV